MGSTPHGIARGVRAGMIATLVIAGATPALAHAIVRSTEPGIDQVVAGPPQRVRMSFSEPVEIAFGAIRVFDGSGRRVDRGEAGHPDGRPDAVEVPLEADLAEGTYTVSWRVISADGHPIEEAFVFHVGRPGANPAGIVTQVLAGEAGAGTLEGILLGIGRWLVFLSLLVLTGVGAFLLFVWRRPKPERGPRPPAVEEAFFRRWRRTLVRAWWVAVGATAASLFLQGAVAGDLPLGEALSLDVVREVARTRFGIVALARLVLLVLAAVLWLRVRRRLGEPPRWVPWLGGAAAVLLLSTPGLSGHAGTTEPVALNVAGDTVHMLAGAAWFGGLVGLVFLAFPATRGLGEGERVRAMAPVISRFSDIAVLAVSALVVSGAYRAWTEIRAIRGLTEAAYGWVFLGKMAVFLPLLALGGINNRFTKPRLDRAAAAGGDDGGDTLRLLRRLVTFEVALVTVVLGVTALLVNLPPSRVSAGITGPFIEDVRIGSYNLEVLVDPNQASAENFVHLTAKTPQGLPADIEGMRVLFRMPAEDIGPLVGEGTELSPGHFVVQGRQLTVPGEWRLEIVATVDRFTEERTTVEVVVNR